MRVLDNTTNYCFKMFNEEAPNHNRGGCDYIMSFISLFGFPALAMEFFALYVR